MVFARFLSPPMCRKFFLVGGFESLSRSNASFFEQHDRMFCIFYSTQKIASTVGWISSSTFFCIRSRLVEDWPLNHWPWRPMFRHKSLVREAMLVCGRGYESSFARLSISVWLLCPLMNRWTFFRLVKKLCVDFMSWVQLNQQYRSQCFSKSRSQRHLKDLAEPTMLSRSQLLTLRVIPATTLRINSGPYGLIY